MFGNNPGLRDRFAQAGDFLLANAGSKAGLVDLQAHQQQQQLVAQNAAELQRQMALAQFKAANPEPTVTQRTYEYLKSIGRNTEAETYLRAQANPQTLMTDPTTGALGFYPKGGIAPSAAGVQAGPQPGEVHDGYTYLGGDPSQQTSWRKQ